MRPLALGCGIFLLVIGFRERNLFIGAMGAFLTVYAVLLYLMDP